MKRCLACFVLGGIFAAGIMLAVYSSKMDNLYITNRQLLLEQEEVKSKLRILETRLAQYHTLIVVGVDYKYDSIPDDLKRLELQRQLKSVVETLLGQAVRALKPDMVIALLDNRVVQVGEANYRIRVRAVTLAEVIYYYLDITEHLVTEEDEG
jgi:hypothetical protein